MNENRKSNRLTMFFNITNIALIVTISLITKKQEISVIITLLIDAIIIALITIKNIKILKFEFDIINNMKYVSNDMLDKIGMFIIYFIGFKNTFEYGAIYLVAINFETLITDAQWDMSYAIITTATIDSSKNSLNYKKSINNAYKLIAILITSTLIMGIILYFYYLPVLWILAVLLVIQFIDLLLSPTVWIKEQYCQVNISPKIATINQGIEKIIRIICSFLPTPFCTYIGQLFSTLYQATMFNLVYRNRYYLKDGMLEMKNDK